MIVSSAPLTKAPYPPLTRSPFPNGEGLRYENTAIPETKPSPRGEGGERSEPDRVLAV